MATPETNAHTFQITKNNAQIFEYNKALYDLRDQVGSIVLSINRFNQYAPQRKENVEAYLAYRKIRDAPKEVPQDLTIQQLLIDKNPILNRLPFNSSMLFFLFAQKEWLSFNAHAEIKESIETQKKAILAKHELIKAGKAVHRTRLIRNLREVINSAPTISKMGAMKPLEEKITINLDQIADQLIAHPNIERINISKAPIYNGISFGVSFVGLIMQDSGCPEKNLPIQLPPIYINTILNSDGTTIEQTIHGEMYRGYNDYKTYHPHDISTEFCFGDFKGPLALMAAAGDICGYVYILMQFLQQYNSNDPAGRYACRWLYEENALTSWEDAFRTIPPGDIHRVDQDNAFLYDIKENGIFQDIVLHTNDPYSVMHNGIDNLYEEPEPPDSEAPHCPEATVT